MGFGHLSRCNALAEHALELGWQVSVFSLYPLANKCDPRIAFIQSSSEFDLSDAIRRKAPDWLLLDNYLLGGIAGKVYADIACRKAFIDDLFTGCDANIDLVISPAGAAEEKRLVGLYPDAKRLLGYSYSLLSSRFRCARTAYTQRSRVLITFGGSDVAGLTVPVVSALVHAGVTGVDVVITDAMGHSELVFPGVQVHQNLNPMQMADLQGKAAVAISAAGGTIFELACCGVPSVICVVADNQLQAASEFAANPGYEVVDCRGVPHIGEIADAYQRLQHSSARRVVHDAAINMVDGLGCKRVLEAMSQYE